MHMAAKKQGQKKVVPTPGHPWLHELELAMALLSSPQNRLHKQSKGAEDSHKLALHGALEPSQLFIVELGTALC